MDKLLHFYEQELGRLREATRRFAEAHPTTAAALELEPDASTDPEVERLLQSVALLNAATQQMIVDGRSDFHRALLHTLQPHYLRAVPACGIVQVDASAAHPNQISSLIFIPRGTILRYGANKFVTAYDACIAPIEITAARFQATIDLPSALRLPGEATSDLVITIESTASSASLDQPAVPKLRICIDGEPELRAGLLDAILMDSLCVCLETDVGWKVLAESPFNPVGGNANESLLPPNPGQQSPRLLTEFFHLPQKFEFIDLDLEAVSACCPPGCKRVSLHIVLPSCEPRLRAAGAGNFKLGCTPVVNIFKQTAAHIHLDGRNGSYPLVPSQAGCEIYGIEEVAVMNRSGNNVLPPFHGTEHWMPGPYWQLDEQEGFALRFIDRDQRSVSLQSGTVIVQLHCTNSDPLQPSEKLKTEAATGGFPIRFVHGITAPSLATLPGPLCESLYAEGTTLPALRGLLERHGCKYVESLKQLVSKPATAWLEHPMGRVHMHGTEITIVLDEQTMRAHCIHAFAELLACTLADKLHENRFVQLRIANESGRLLHVDKPRVGTRPLV